MKPKPRDASRVELANLLTDVALGELYLSVGPG